MSTPAPTAPAAAPAAPPPASLAGKVAGARIATSARDEGTRLSGEVVTRDGQPIAGANVIVQGTTVGSTTDSRGRFSLVSPADSGTLQVRRLGFQSVSLPIARAKADSTSLRVPLTPAVQSLSAVVVTSAEQPIERQRVASATAKVSSDALPTVSTCWRVVMVGDAASLVVPTYLQLPPLVAASTIDVRWFGWPRSGVARSVPTQLDAAGGLTGRATVEGTSLQLVLTRTTDAWSGTAVSQQGTTRRDGAIVLSGVPDAMCRP
jgi:hypothetical protein